MRPAGRALATDTNAHAIVYVLEGSVVMQLKGGKQVTLTAGQTFYEGPDDVHVVDRNASSTKPAKFVVFLIKGKGVRRSLESEFFRRQLLEQDLGLGDRQYQSPR